MIDGTVTILRGRRIDTANTCTMLAEFGDQALTPQRDSWLIAVRDAKDWLTGALEHADSLDIDAVLDPSTTSTEPGDMTTAATKTFVEAPLTLTDAPPRTLGVWAQTAMWASFGVTLFGPLTGALVALSAGSVELGLLAALVGAVIGALLYLGQPAAIGARLRDAVHGRPARPARPPGPLAPTVLNIAQNVGWAMMEIIVISSAAAVIAGEQWRWPFRSWPASRPP